MCFCDIYKNVFIVPSQRRIYIDTWQIVFTPYTLEYNNSKWSLIVVCVAEGRGGEGGEGGMGLMDLRKFSWIDELLQVA
jgi:hypothetical protein